MIILVIVCGAGLILITSSLSLIIKTLLVLMLAVSCIAFVRHYLLLKNKTSAVALRLIEGKRFVITLKNGHQLEADFDDSRLITNRLVFIYFKPNSLPMRGSKMHQKLRNALRLSPKRTLIITPEHLRVTHNGQTLAFQANAMRRLRVLVKNDYFST